MHIHSYIYDTYIPCTYTLLSSGLLQWPQAQSCPGLDPRPSPAGLGLGRLQEAWVMQGVCMGYVDLCGWICIHMFWHKQLTLEGFNNQAVVQISFRGSVFVLCLAYFVRSFHCQFNNNQLLTGNIIFVWTKRMT